MYRAIVIDNTMMGKKVITVDSMKHTPSTVGIYNINLDMFFIKYVQYYSHR